MPRLDISDYCVFKYISLYEDLERKRLKVPYEEPLLERTKPVPYIFKVMMHLFYHLPYPDCTPGTLSPESIYNYKLSRVEMVIENVFRIAMSSKFRVLLKPKTLKPDKVEGVV